MIGVDEMGVWLMANVLHFMAIKHLKLWEVTLWSDIPEKKLKRWLRGKDYREITLRDISALEWMMQLELINITITEN